MRKYIITEANLEMEKRTGPKDKRNHFPGGIPSLAKIQTIVISKSLLIIVIGVSFKALHGPRHTSCKGIFLPILWMQIAFEAPKVCGDPSKNGCIEEEITGNKQLKILAAVTFSRILLHKLHASRTGCLDPDIAKPFERLAEMRQYRVV